MQLLHSQARGAERSLFTKYVFGIWLVRYLLLPLESLAEIPRQYYTPAGLLSWIPLSVADLLHDGAVLTGLRVLLIAACAACLSKRTFLLAAPLACVLITLEQTFIRSFSVHMNHAEVNLMFAAYLFTAFAYADRFKSKPANADGNTRAFTRDGIPLFAIALVLCLTYYLVGMTRLFYGGVSVYTGDTILNHTLHFSQRPWFFDYSLDSLFVETWPIAMSMKVGFALATVVEILAPVCLISRRFGYFFIVFMVVFHLLIVLAMKIVFLENVLLLVFLTDVGAWFRGKHSRA